MSSSRVVVITGAAGQIGYSLLPMIASGQVFGPDVVVELRLLEIPQVSVCQRPCSAMLKKHSFFLLFLALCFFFSCLPLNTLTDCFFFPMPSLPPSLLPPPPTKQGLAMLEGVKMELLDCAFDTLGDIVCTTDPLVAFKDADVAFLVGGFPRRPGMLRKDLIQINTKIFLSMGQAMEAVASANIKVLVVANPANTNALVALKQCTRIPSKNFCAMTRLDYNRASAQVALKVGTSVKNVKNVIIWGNHSASQYPDPTTDGYVVNADGTTSLLSSVLTDEAWLRNEFMATVQQRGKSVMEARGKSSALSAANAAADCVRTWLVTGTQPNETVSMAVYNDEGYYGIAKDLMYSLPCECKDGDWSVKTGLTVSGFGQEKMKASEAELLEERSAAMEILNGGGEEASTKQ